MTDGRSNELLLKAMTKLARKRDEASRKSMYMVLLRATLCVPTEDDPDEAEGERFAQEEPLHGRDVYAAFTSLDELSRWRPESADHTTMTGAELVTILATCDFASLVINPGGDVRGELYKHEVQMLAEAVPRLRAWRNPPED
ncbi:MAG: hypothetical protein CL940_05170 [Deltaproteobacteria bacterium]|nr:hypothetical protein [Deltaproteobacteria bacterium]